MATPSNKNETLRQIVVRVMAEHDYSGRDVERLADAAGETISYVTVNEIANGKRKRVTEPKLVALSAALKVPVERLREAAGMPAVDTSTDAELLSLHGQLTPEEKEQALRMYRAQVQALKALRTAPSA